MKSRVYHLDLTENGAESIEETETPQKPQKKHQRPKRAKSAGKRALSEGSSPLNRPPLSIENQNRVGNALPKFNSARSEQINNELTVIDIESMRNLGNIAGREKAKSKRTKLKLEESLEEEKGQRL